MTDKTIDKTIDKMNEITLKYLMNPAHYDRYCEESEQSNDDFLADKKFYRKRVINITKNMFKEEFENDSLKGIFDLYIQNVIDYFKELDTKDILQREYEHLVLPNKETNVLDQKVMANADALIFIEPKKQTLDKFVNIIRNISKNEKLPIKKEIDLKDPKLKKKGVKREKKDKNIQKEQKEAE